MIDNAIFKLCQQKNLFLSNINLRIMFLRGFLRLLINCLNSKRSNFSFCAACFFNCFYLLHLDLLYRYIQVVKIYLFLYRYIQVVKIFLFTLKISLLLFFHDLLFQNMLIKLAEKECPQHILRNVQHEFDCSIKIYLIKIQIPPQSELNRSR